MSPELYEALTMDEKQHLCDCINYIRGYLSKFPDAAPHRYISRLPECHPGILALVDNASIEYLAYRLLNFSDDPPMYFKRNKALYDRVIDHFAGHGHRGILEPDEPFSALVS